MQSTSRSNAIIISTCSGARSDALECAFEKETNKMLKMESLLMTRYDKDNETVLMRCVYKKIRDTQKRKHYKKPFIKGMKL